MTAAIYCVIAKADSRPENRASAPLFDLFLLTLTEKNRVIVRIISPELLVLMYCTYDNSAEFRTLIEPKIQNFNPCKYDTAGKSTFTGCIYWLYQRFIIIHNRII